MQQSSFTHFAMTGGVGALLGGAVGFGLGVLLAPEAGKKTRRRLVYQLERLGWRVADLHEHLTQSSTQSSEARRSADELVSDAQTQAERIRDDIDDLLEEIRHQAEQEESSEAP